MTLTFPPNDLWDFSLKFYAKPGIAPLCLDLQERHGADVNALLFCLWLARSRRGRLSPAELNGVLDRVAPWNAEIVRPLRALRKRLKTPVATEDRAVAEAYRRTVQKLELDAERIEQMLLAQEARPVTVTPRELSESIEDAVGLLKAFFARLGLAPAAGAEIAQTMLTACFDIAPAKAAKAWALA